MGKVSEAGQAGGYPELQSIKGGATGALSLLVEGEQAQHDPGFSFFPVGPKPSTWLRLCKSGWHVDLGFQLEGHTG